MYNLLKKHKVSLVYLPLSLYWLVLFILTSLPASRLPDAKINDKVEHYIAFAVLAVLLSLTFQFQEKIRILAKQSYLFCIILIAIYGLLDELHQMYVPGRYCDVKDWIADVLGGLAGIGLVFLLKKIGRKTAIN